MPKRIRVKELQYRALQYRVTPEKALESLRDFHTKLGDFLVLSNPALHPEPSDALRIRHHDRLTKPFQHHLSRGLERLLILSALANPSKEIKAGQQRVQRASAKEKVKWERYLDDVGKILSKGTGLDRKLCREIMKAYAHSRSGSKKWVRKAWPVSIREVATRSSYIDKIATVTGPKGSMPLSGDGCPHYIYDAQRNQVT